MFAIKSGHKFNVLAKDLSKDWSVRISQSVAYSDQEIHTLQHKTDANQFALLVKASAGSRRCDMLGAKVRRDIMQHF